MSSDDDSDNETIIENDTEENPEDGGKIITDQVTLEKAKATRTSTRRKITKLLKKIEEETQKPNVSLIKLNIMMSQLSEQESIIKETNSVIYRALPKELIEKEIDAREKCEDDIITARVTLEHYIDIARGHGFMVSPTGSTSTPSTSSVTNNTAQFPGVNSPTLTNVNQNIGGINNQQSAIPSGSATGPSAVLVTPAITTTSSAGTTQTTTTTTTGNSGPNVGIVTQQGGQPVYSQVPFQFYMPAMPFNNRTTLPKLEIPKFNGNLSKWTDFWSQFESAIHNNTQLSKSVKFSYLKTYLQDTAANAIAGLAISDDNYDTAIQRLETRFGRKDVLVTAHIGKLMNLQPVHKSNDLNAYRRFFDTCEMEVKSLQALGIKASEKYGTILCPMLLNKLPEDINFEFSRLGEADGELDVEKLLNFLRKDLQSRERAYSFRTKTAEDTKSDNTNRSYNIRTNNSGNKFNRYQNGNNNKPWNSSAAALSTGTSVQNNGFCLFCRRNTHKSEACKAVTNVDERKIILRKLGRCYVCIIAGHVARNCDSPIKCNKCKGKHHAAVCQNKEFPRGEEERNKTEETTPKEISSNSVVPSRQKENAVLLQTARAQLKGPKNSREIRLLIDSGSQTSFIREDISRKLGLTVIGEVKLKLHVFGVKEPTLVTRRRVKIYLKSVIDDRAIEMEAVETPNINTARFETPGENFRRDLEERGLILADGMITGRNLNEELDALIGSDYYWQVITGRIERINTKLVAVESIFGWIIQGPTEVSSVNACSSLGISHVAINHVANSTKDEVLTNQLKAFWELESLGISEEESIEKSELKKLSLAEFERNISYNENRYTVKLPWKSNKEELSNNYFVALRRLLSLKHKFERNEPYYRQYSKIINEYEKEGIVERVPLEELGIRDNVYYLPHSGVEKEERKTTKLRVVVDGSSKEKGKASLNDCLCTGSNLNPDLLDVLLKFRTNKIAFIADVEKAFLQIDLHPEDRNAVRFLWFEEPTKFKEPLTLIEMRFARVAFGLNSSPHMLAATIRTHTKGYEESHPETCEMINEEMYVDDLASGASNEDTALKRCREAKEIMSSAGMNLRKWQSNSEILRNEWRETGWIEPIVEDKDSRTTTVLGLAWNTDSDILSYQTEKFLGKLESESETKRGVLKVSARLYDPLGFITPFTVRIKILFQEIWIENQDWDEPLSEELSKKFRKICADIPRIKEITIPRYIQEETKEENIREVQLHCFSDASKKAFGSVIYARYLTEKGNISVSLVMSKTKVAPIKEVKTTNREIIEALKLPKLELLGALVGARLTTRVRKFYPNAKVYYWCDNTAALNWIKGESHRWIPFVANRVKEIQASTEIGNWKHCKGQENPADYLTRGENLEALQRNENWWKGPNWLRMPEESWPSNRKGKSDEDDGRVIEESLRPKFRTTAQNISATQIVLKPVFNIEKYENINRVIRITGWIRRFSYNCRKTNEEKLSGPLSAEEIDESENYWTKLVQGQEYQEEIENLRRKHKLPQDSKIAELNPFIDDQEILRVGGRLHNSEFSFEEKHPILLPKQNYYSNLQIKRAHVLTLHSGLADSLTQLRERFWIVKGRAQTKKIIKDCLICKKWRAKPKTEETAPLPKDRVIQGQAFDVTGIDFAGPLYIREKKERVKSYLALYTCATTRAIHLELVSSLSTESFLLSLRRFVSRRGVPSIIYTDNAKTFKKAEKELIALWKKINKERVKEFFGERKIEWKYIVERAPWYGGWWERLVGSVKVILRKILGNAFLNFEEMGTVLTEVEAVLNSRPLTYVNDEAGEPSPLTPAHFLTGNRLTCLPSRKGTEIQNPQGEEIRKRWLYQEGLIDKLWNRWKKEYLLNLKSAHQIKPSQVENEMKRGDVVIVMNENIPRPLWKMARIEETLRGRDGRIRSCLLKLPHGNQLRRPINLLCPLELQ